MTLHKNNINKFLNYLHQNVHQILILQLDHPKKVYQAFNNKVDNKIKYKIIMIIIIN